MSPSPSRNGSAAETIHLTEQNFDEALVRPEPGGSESRRSARAAIHAGHRWLPTRLGWLNSQRSGPASIAGTCGAPTKG